MGASKTDSFTEGQQAIASIAKALGHPAWGAIVEFRVKVDGCICNDIVDKLPLSQATISQHLRALKDAGLIKGSIEGNAICYCVEGKTVKKLQSYIAGISAKLTAKGTECC